MSKEEKRWNYSSTMKEIFLEAVDDRSHLEKGVFALHSILETILEATDEEFSADFGSLRAHIENSSFDLRNEFFDAFSGYLQYCSLEEEDRLRDDRPRGNLYKVLCKMGRSDQDPELETSAYTQQWAIEQLDAIEKTVTQSQREDVLWYEELLLPNAKIPKDDIQQGVGVHDTRQPA